MNKERIIWIDKMKVIGMYLIIAGHLFPMGYTYIYTFSVPLFFFISGFLYKQEKSQLIYWKKIVFNYILPVFYIRTIMYFWEKHIYTNSDHFFSIFDYWILMLKGYQNCIGACWFIYTLILIKSLFQYMPNLKARIALFILFTCIAIYLNSHNIHKNNAIINLTVAYQPYVLGFIFKQYKHKLNSYQPSLRTIIVVLVIGASLLVFCSTFNGNVWLYKNNYGSSFLLYLIGIFAGVVIVFHLSKFNDHVNTNIIITLSAGNIVTLGFHQIPINLTRLYMPPLPYFSYIIALIILLSFYPIIKFFQFYFPFIIGNYHPPK